MAMFTDGRSKRIVFVAHCVLNQNAISDGTAIYPAAIKEIIDYLCTSHVGIVQMPCPEFLCLGLDRGNINGSSVPVVEENTRIRKMMNRDTTSSKIRQLVQEIVFQITEYRKYGFFIGGIIGINRSPSCGVETTSKNNQEVEGEGVFIKALRKELEKNRVHVEIVGIKADELERSLQDIQNLISIDR